MNDMPRNFSPCCPMCGQVRSAKPFDIDNTFNVAIDGQEVRLPRRLGQVLDKLNEAYPKGVRRRDLADALYGDDPDGGPLDLDNCLESFVCRVRKAIAPAGFAIKANRHVGYQLVRAAQ